MHLQKYSRSFAYIACLSSLTLCALAPNSAHGQNAGAAQPSVEMIKTVYVESDDTIPNPERGFATQNDVPWPSKVTWGFCGQGQNFAAYDYTAWNEPLAVEFLRNERREGRTLIQSRYHLADFRNRDLTPAYLDFLKNDFDAARLAGVKIVLRFAYNYPMGGPDAPLAVIQKHIDQLQPVLRDNVDVIAYMEAGFVGCWGEWHDSSNQLESAGFELSPSQRIIIDKLLRMLPRERALAVRYAHHKFDYLHPDNDQKPVEPLSAKDAFNGSDRARLATHDDCFVCSDTHGGGYVNPRSEERRVGKEC